MNSKEYVMPDGKKAVFEYDHDGIGKVTIEAMDMLMGLITEGRKRGKWIWQSSMAGSFIERRYRCSNCQYEITTQREEPIYNYCPNCGARMKGADDE